MLLAPTMHLHIHAVGLGSAHTVGHRTLVLASVLVVCVANGQSLAVVLFLHAVRRQVASNLTPLGLRQWSVGEVGRVDAV